MKYRTDANIVLPSSKVPPPSFEQLSELVMHASISPPQNLCICQSKAKKISTNSIDKALEWCIYLQSYIIENQSILTTNTWKTLCLTLHPCKTQPLVLRKLLRKGWDYTHINTVLSHHISVCSIKLQLQFLVLFRIRPSATCGPFRGEEDPFDIVLDLIASWNDSAWAIIITFITTPGVVAAVIMILW